MFLVGYSAIAINTLITEDTLKPSKKKGKNKKDATEQAIQDIPPPPKLSFTEGELSNLTVCINRLRLFYTLSCIINFMKRFMGRKLKFFSA